MRICIDARITTSSAGGIEQFVIGLAAGLSTLGGNDEKYLFLCYSDHSEWLEPFLKGPCRIVPTGPSPTTVLWKRLLKSTLPEIKHLYNRIPIPLKNPVASSDGLIERLGANVIHFTTQGGFFTRVPSIYHPHDLQHLHFPHLFPKRIQVTRERVYRQLCRQAQLVCVSSTWTGIDVKTRYDVPDHKLCVIPLPPPIDAYLLPRPDDIIETRRRYRLPPRFVLYPSRPWPHKNHIGLVEALSFLPPPIRSDISVVFTCERNEFPQTVLRRIKQLGMEDQIRFLGFVSPSHLRCLYQLAHAVVIPSKFESASFPMFEAFRAGIPVASSNVTSLPEQAGDAALLFNPDQPREIAAAIIKLWSDPSLRRELVDRGLKRVSQFRWDKTAKLFRAQYRRLSRRPLTDEDHDLLSRPANL